METITLTLIDANPERLAEELSAALGFPVAVYIRREAGQIGEALIQRTDGLLFVNKDIDTAYSVAAAHDPARLSTVQTIEKDRLDARNTALADLDTADLVDLRNAIAASVDLSALKATLSDLVDLVGDLITLARVA